MTETIFETDRLRLRKWRESDVDPWCTISADPHVMAHLGPLMDRHEVTAMVARMIDLGHSAPCVFWIVERREDAAMMGFCGLKPGPAGTPLEGRTEIGWRLGRPYWGHGYAIEAARASLDWGWANLDAPDIWAMTTPANTRSWGLMDRLDMVREVDLDFDHPAFPDGDPLRRHIIYRIGRPS